MRVISGRGALEIPTTGDPAGGPLELPDEAIEELVAARRATPREVLRPSTIQSGGFRLVRADPGSADFLLDAYGLLAPILLSNPIQFVLTLQAILGTPTRVLLRYWPHGRSREPEIRKLDEEIRIDDGELRVGASLPPGSRLRLQYKGPGPAGRELELELETPPTSS